MKYWIGIRGVKDTKWWQYLFLLCILVGGFYFYKTTGQRRDKRMLNQHYKGVIAKKYEDNDGGYIYLNSNKRKITTYHNTTFYLLGKGDSVI